MMPSDEESTTTLVQRGKQQAFNLLPRDESLCNAMMASSVRSPFSLYASKNKAVQDNEKRRIRFGMTNRYCDFVFIRSHVQHFDAARAKSNTGTQQFFSTFMNLARSNEDLDRLHPLKREHPEVDDQGNEKKKDIPLFVHDSFTTRHLVMDNWMTGRRVFRQDPLIFNGPIPSINPDDELLFDLIKMKSMTIIDGLDKHFMNHEKRVARIDPAIKDQFAREKIAFNDMTVVNELECSGGYLGNSFKCKEGTSGNTCIVIGLDMHDCDLETIPDTLNKIDHLEDLNLNKNRITKINNINKLVNLKKLDLSDNKIDRIDGLDTLAKLRDLNLSMNKLNRIENIRGLDKLATLNVENNAISSIKSINPGNLKRLKVKGNPIPIDDLDAFKEAHPGVAT